MYHPPSKRKQLLRRIAIYSLMSFAVVGLVTLLVFATLGYRYNQGDGLVQTGLVQFGSQPSSAQVTINDMTFGSRTPSKASLEAGEHTIAMQRNGYHSWQKTVDVVGGSVLWLNYVRLVPTELKPMNVAKFSAVSSTAVSPDAKWMLVLEKPTSTTLQLIDLTKDTSIEPVPLKLPTAIFTAPAEGKTQRFELMEWDSSGRYVIIKHSYGDKHEWLVVDTRDVALSQNITRLLGINASRVVFGNDSNSVLYAQIDDVVRRIDRSNATLSRPLVENVETFSLYDDDTVLFTRQLDSTKKRDVGYYRGSDGKTHVLGSFADYKGVPATLAIGQYFGDTYVALSQGGEVAVSTGSLARPDEFESVAKMEFAGVEHLSIVTAGRFVIAQAGATYVVYDLELKKTTTTKLKGSGDVKGGLRWLDGYNVWSDRGGMLRLYEFDGANQHDIMKVVPGFNVTLSPNARYLYGITKSGDTFHLSRVQMIL